MNKRDNCNEKKTFLLTFNPKNFTWENFYGDIKVLKEDGCFRNKWSCGNSNRLKVGDRVFIIRLGSEPRGIFASGYVYDGVYLATHWNEEKRNKGEVAKFVTVDFDYLGHFNNVNEMLPMDTLKKISDSFKWSSQSSGIEIPKEIANKLEKQWEKIAPKKYESYIREDFTNSEVLKSDDFYEGTTTKIEVNKYERNLSARKKCIEHYGYSCSVCNINMEDIYGELGKNMIHIHHIKPLYEIKKEYLLDPIKDLRPVCPNCHSIIHRRRPSYSIDEVKSILNK